MPDSTKKPAYFVHEDVYKTIEKNNTKSWNEHIGNPDIEPAYFRFLDDLYEDKSIAKPNRVLELGCGTGQLLRYLCKRFNCSGHGIDVSHTAIKLAKQQTKSLKSLFKKVM
ncbi:class I SAM-dependent methyltransferase [Planctomycetota bacterium]|nr:class I SAM-dependent methyltransferase [Planctomycetota bacterium]